MRDVVYLAALDKAREDPVLSALLDGATAPFDRAEWLALQAARPGVNPLFAVARRGTDAAVLALRADAGVLRPLSNWYTFRWRPLVTPGADPAPLLESLCRDLARRGWRIVLEQVPDEDGSAAALEAALRRTGWATRREVHDTNHFLRVNGRDYAGYLASRPGPLRTTLKRRAARVDCSIRTAFDPQDWAEYEAIYAQSWKPEEGDPALLRSFAEQEGAAGRLRLGLARIEGRAVAAQLWTVEDGTAFIHKLAHREDSKALSPGTVLSAVLFAHAIDRDGVSLVDFGTGDDPYKRDWMDDIRPRYRIDAMRPLDPRAWPRLARRALRR